MIFSVGRDTHLFPENARPKNSFCAPITINKPEWNIMQAATQKVRKKRNNCRLTYWTEQTLVLNSCGKSTFIQNDTAI